jgi:hypothetical protein
LILDTNALSAAAEEHPGVMKILIGAQQLAIPVVVILSRNGLRILEADFMQSNPGPDRR